VVLVVGACGGDDTQAPAADAIPAAPDAAASVEDLDMSPADFTALRELTPVPGRNYRVANPLGHLDEALAVAASPTGGEFPVGTVVLASRVEPMVKRRRGWNPATRDWEFFSVNLAPDGVTALSFAVRGREETPCFSCHASVSSPTWDFICDHP
jgi:hypothetical protein